MREILRFGGYELDPGAYRLRHGGRVVRLERIPLDLLFLLAERRGQLVTRQEILGHIWGKDIALDVDNSINTAVLKIRRAVKDNSENPRFLHTIPGKGYRFDADCVEVELPAAVEALPAAPPPEPEELVPIPAPPRRRWRRLTLAAAAVVGTGVLGALLMFRYQQPSTSKTMLAVLPFANLSGDAAQEYFADGMTEEMIAELGSLDPAHLGVIARTSMMQYKNARKSGSQIAAELSVGYLLEGSIRRAGGRVRVTAQLIQARDQTHVWAESFDRASDDILELQGEVARAIAGKIRTALSAEAEARLSRAAGLNPQAHEDYLRGLYEWNFRTPEGTSRAIESFQHAIATDAHYAPAYAGLARVYSLASIFVPIDAVEAFSKAREYATRALALDGSLADAHTTLGFVKAHQDFDWPGARLEFQRGIELNPSDPYCHFFYANSYLSPMRQHREAIAEMKKAIEMDPLSPPLQSFVGRTYFYARDYPAALAQFQRAIRLNPAFALNYVRLSNLYEYTGDYSKAIAELTRARMLSGEEPESVVAKEEGLRKALAARGPRGYWEKVLELEAIAPNPPEAGLGADRLAMIYSNLGEFDKALTVLEDAYAQRRATYSYLGIEPAFDPLRSNPRFIRLMRTVHLALDGATTPLSAWGRAGLLAK
jgi:TolB-like protein/DNA-binding winged helix-turn-helix (wHTH) protein/Tfp pilus assembly protein PilF